jgi:hypothetical protein
MAERTNLGTTTRGVASAAFLHTPTLRSLVGHPRGWARSTSHPRSRALLHEIPYHTTRYLVNTHLPIVRLGVYLVPGPEAPHSPQAWGSGRAHIGYHEGTVPATLVLGRLQAQEEPCGHTHPSGGGA